MNFLSPNSDQFMVGVAADTRNLSPREIKLMRDGGIRWLRSGGFGFDFEKFLKNEKQPDRFFAFKERTVSLRNEGFRFLGITPLPAEMPGLAGTPGTSAYLDQYRKACSFLSKEYHGLIDYWQVANELDIWIFRASLSLEQSVDFLKAGIEGLKATDCALKVGINLTLFPSQPGRVDGNTDRHEGVFIAENIYKHSGLDLDYAGFDSYPGTWREGGAESWDEYLTGFHELTGKPVIIQEFGYASQGGIMNESEVRSGLYPCAAKKWKFAWEGAHTPEIQARFIEESFQIFAGKPFLLGAIYYRWNDQQTCWQCGRSDCPAETAWGLVDVRGNPKPSYYSLQKCARGYFPGLMPP